jgi:hypothetical protein
MEQPNGEVKKDITAIHQPFLRVYTWVTPLFSPIARGLEAAYNPVTLVILGQRQVGLG